MCIRDSHYRRICQITWHSCYTLCMPRWPTKVSWIFQCKTKKIPSHLATVRNRSPCYWHICQTLRALHTVFKPTVSNPYRQPSLCTTSLSKTPTRSFLQAQELQPFCQQLVAIMFQSHILQALLICQLTTVAATHVNAQTKLVRFANLYKKKRIPL